MSDSKEKRTKSITVWLTVDEYNELMEKKTQARIGAWVRETCLGVPQKKRYAKTADPQLLYQLAKIGGNLNQIAKHLNTFGTIDRIKILSELAVIRGQLDKLLEQHDS